MKMAGGGRDAGDPRGRRRRPSPLAPCDLQVSALRSIPLVVCLALLAAVLGLAALPSPVAAQSGAPMAYAKYDVINLRTGPSTAYPAVAELRYGEGCPIAGRDVSTGWWLLSCPNNLRAWTSYDVVTVTGDVATAPLYTVSGGAIVAPPEQLAPPPPATFAGWQASYFANKDLSGVPVMVQDAPEVNFNWGAGSPGPNVPTDYFSARYERTLNLPAGSYFLTLRMDDGARVFIDDRVVMDDWRMGSWRELSSVVSLGGLHRFRVEYFEDSGQAALYFAIAPYGAAPAPQPTPPAWQPSAPNLAVPQEQWRAQFFNNTDVAGSPAAAQYEARSFYQLDKNWGANPPVAGVGADYWSARFEGQFFFTPADYMFYAQSDDGVRVWIDNILVIDAWFDGYKERSNRFDRIGEGNHTMRVEFYKRTGGAFLRIWWSFAGSNYPVTGPIPPPPF